MKDYYAILEVLPTASQEAIREQYLLLIQAWHPDKFPNRAQKAKAEEKCKEINTAYDVLKDVRKRARYDGELRGQPTRSSEEEGRRQTEQPRERQRRQAEKARPRTGYERPQRARAESESPRAEHEQQAWEKEEWIRVYFEQARRRQSRQPLAGLSQDSRAPIRVLVVDEVASARARTRELLSREGDVRVVGEASDGVEAIRQFDALMPDVTTVRTNLPTMDGVSVTEAIRRKHPIAKVIIISVQGDTTYIRRAAMAGACDYLVNPPQSDELLLALRLAAGRGASSSERGAAR